MSRHKVPTLSADDFDRAATPNIGASLRLFVSTEEVKPVAKLVQDAVDDTPDGDEGTLTLDPTYSAPESATQGRDFQVVLTGPLKSAAAATVVQFNVTYPTRTLPSATVATGSGSHLTFATAHNLVTGDVIAITGSGNTPSISGNKTVTVVSATVVTLDGVTITTAGTVSAVTHAHTGTASATFEAPAYADDATGALPQGWGVDLVPDEAYYNTLATGFRSITSLAGITGGSKGAKFSVLALPDADDYYEIRAAVDKNPVYPTASGVSIPERYNASQWVVKGRGENPMLDLSSRSATFANGLARYNGHLVTVKIETLHDDELLVQRQIFGHCTLTLDAKGGDANDPIIHSAKGPYSEFAVFVAA